MGVPQSRPPAVKLSDVVVRLVALHGGVHALAHVAADTKRGLTNPPYRNGSLLCG